MIEDVPTDGRRGKLLWGVVLPVVVLSPAYALLPLSPTASLAWVIVVMLPIGIIGGILGEDRRAENAILNVGWGEVNQGHGDAKIGGRTTPLKLFGAGLGLLAFGSFVVLVVLFV